MTTESNKALDERAAFEAWASAHFGAGLLGRTAGDFYQWDRTAVAWTVWQARAALSQRAPTAAAEAAPVVPSADMRRALDAVYQQLKDGDTMGAALAMEGVLKGIDTLSTPQAVEAQQAGSGGDAMSAVVDMLPCPFCGGTPRIVNYEGSAIHISCRCGAQCWGGRAHFGSVEQAIAAWNTRTSRTAPEEPTREQKLIGYEDAHQIAYQAAAAFRPPYFSGADFEAHNWVVEAVRSAHIDGQRFARGLPPLDRSAALSPELRKERQFAPAEPTRSVTDVLDRLEESTPTGSTAVVIRWQTSGPFTRERSVTIHADNQAPVEGRGPTIRAAIDAALALAQGAAA